MELPSKGWNNAIYPTWTGAADRTAPPAAARDGESGTSRTRSIRARETPAAHSHGRGTRILPDRLDDEPGVEQPDHHAGDRISDALTTAQNPIAGMMDDAKYYFTRTDPQAGGQSDQLATCRPQYIILLSHAAPNEDLEPYCQGGSGSSVGICPYDYPEYIAAGLATGTYSPGAGVINAQSAAASGSPVKTFVVGFSLSSSLGDAGTSSCNDILQGTAPNQTIITDSAHCGVPQTSGGDSGTTGNPLYASVAALARADTGANGGTQIPYFAPDNQTTTCRKALPGDPGDHRQQRDDPRDAGALASVDELERGGGAVGGSLLVVVQPLYDLDLVRGRST